MTEAADPAGMTLVVGASGNLGSEVVRQALATGRKVRAMSRQPSKIAHLQDRGAEVVKGDLLERGSLERACEGVSVVVASAHAALGRGRNSPQTVDARGNRTLIDVSRAAGAAHFVYVSAIGAAPDHPVDFFRIKYETGQYLKSTDLSWSIVSGAAFMETQHDMVGAALADKGRAIVFGRGDKKSNYVSVVDVARFVVLALDDPRFRGRVIEVGGPENLTRNEVVSLYERTIGRRAKRTHIPAPVLQTLRVVVGPFNPVARRLLTMGTILATEDHSFDMGPTLSEFPMELTRYEDCIAKWHEERQ
jgi:NADH dehydrogenase